MTLEFEPIHRRRFVVRTDIFGEPVRKAEFDEWKKNPIKVVSQEEGVVLLHAHLEGRLPFKDLQPFLIEEARGDHKVGARFFIGGRIKGKLVSFSLNENSRKALGAGIMVAIPGQDENHLYQWIHFYELGLMDIVDLSKHVQSFRVDLENLKMQSWLGPERQMFLDYLDGKDIVSAEMLKPFGMRLTNQVDDFYIGTINGKHIYFSNVELKDALGAVLVFRPKIASGNSTFLEISTVNSEGKEKLIDRRSFRKGETRLSKLIEIPISPDQANEQLEKLLEGQGE